MEPVAPSRVIELLAEFGPHGLADHQELVDVDVFEYFRGKDLARLDFSAITHGLTLRFRDSDLRQCNFRGTHMHGSSFVGSDLRGADFRDAQIGGNTSFGVAPGDDPASTLDGVRFDNARIGQATISSLGLNRCVFAGATVNADLINVDLSYANLSGTRLSGEVRSSDLTGITGTDMQVEGIWTDCVLDGVHLPNATLGGSGQMFFVDCRGEGVSLPWAALGNTELLECTFPGIDLRGCSLREAFIDGSDLSGAQLQGSDLTGTEISGGSLAGADLTGATVDGLAIDNLDLTGAILDAGQIDTIEMSNVTGP